MARLERAEWISQKPCGNQKRVGKVAIPEITKADSNFSRGLAGGKNLGQPACSGRKNGEIRSGKTASGFGGARNATVQYSSGILSTARCGLRLHRSRRGN